MLSIQFRLGCVTQHLYPQLEKEIIIHKEQMHCRIKNSSQEVDAAWPLPSISAPAHLPWLLPPHPASLPTPSCKL